MHTVEILEVALHFCERLGYRVRQEYLGDVPGGGCLLRGQKWLFLDLSLNANEQLGVVLETLRKDPSLSQFTPPRCLRSLLSQRSAAA
jgi:hypothetical protein